MIYFLFCGFWLIGFGGWPTATLLTIFEFWMTSGEGILLRLGFFWGGPWVSEKDDFLFWLGVPMFPPGFGGCWLVGDVIVWLEVKPLFILIFLKKWERERNWKKWKKKKKKKKERNMRPTPE